MKHIKLFENWESINEEWIPNGPFMSLKSNEKGDIAEFYEMDDDDDDGDECGIQFIGGGHGDHSKNILDILNALKDIQYVTDRFNCHGVDDCRVLELSIYKDNLKNVDIKQFTKELQKWGDVSEVPHMKILKVTLKEPFVIEVPDSEEKGSLKFSKKLDRLYYLLENKTIEQNDEIESLVDSLISKIERP